MNAILKEHAPKDPDSQKIVAAILAGAACQMAQKGMPPVEAVTAVLKTYEYILTDSGGDACLAIWEAVRGA